MVNKLDFAALQNVLEGEESAVTRWKSREPSQMVQMSIRMHANVYDTFRSLCKFERRTNGDMLEVLLQKYLTERAKTQKDK
jgi:hypothetical protein